MAFERWVQKTCSSPRVISINRTGLPSRISPSSFNTSSTEMQYSPGSYSTVQDDRFHPEYEDPENFYEKPPDVVEKKKFPSPPPLPPPLTQTTLQKLVEHQILKKPSKSRESRCGCKFNIFLIALIFLAGILAFAAFLFFWQRKTIEVSSSSNTVETVSLNPPLSNKKPNLTKKITEPLIPANTLLTYLITKRKICLFEVSTLHPEESRIDFETEHIEAANLLFFNNLSHAGVPVHPLQFQRYIRNLGVDGDCHIIVYDKGEQIWASYAFWIFKLFGHERISLLNGGFPEWKRLQQTEMGPYTISMGPVHFSDYVGDFQSRWTSEYISAFDDVLANFDTKKYDIVDAQSPEEYDGTAQGAIFGHIRGAINIPPEDILDIANNTWLDKSQTAKIFSDHGLEVTKPVIVYCGTSLHASMVWFGLHRLQFDVTVYFGSWPEWVIRAPDYLKVVPESSQSLPDSKENLRQVPDSIAKSATVPKALSPPTQE
ncbi:hypothetical protein FO519_000142 [Halicephalobus sp. NKZ332]|nr:hypothetical protein FO519_000142 [Halicephalobus sp. NKZ332]